MNSIMPSDDANEESEFLSALNASPESFVHRGRAVPRVFLSSEANSTNLHRDLPYTDRVSSQTLC